MLSKIMGLGALITLLHKVFHKKCEKPTGLPVFAVDIFISPQYL
jgi:hypothetical protein